MAKKSFILYCDMKAPIESLSDEEAGKLFKAVFEYNNGGVTQELSPAADMAFTFLKQQFARDAEKYEAIVERNRKNGKTGGRPVTQANPEEPKEPSGFSGNPDEPKQPDNDNDNGNDTGNGNDKKEESPEHVRLATLLMELHQVGDEAFTKSASQLNTWAKDMRLLITRDGRTIDEVEKVMTWCKQPDNFWFSNIMSGKKFREKYPTVRAQWSKTATGAIAPEKDYGKGW